MTHQNYQEIGLDVRIMRPNWDYRPTSNDTDHVRFREGWHNHDCDWVGQFQGKIGSVTVDNPGRLVSLDIGDHIRLDNVPVLAWNGWSGPYNIKALGDYEVIARKEQEDMKLQRFNGRTKRFEDGFANEGIAYLLQPLVEFDKKNFESYQSASGEAKVANALLKIYSTRRNRALHSVAKNLAKQASLPKDEVRRIFSELGIKVSQSEKVQCTLSSE
ncbi:hypothetical protein HY495_02860 [Candidatus Woesearchaeota archaeon]|nr:hypothetical protein [Candidatus Woesearchaeota archaeon]